MKLLLDENMGRKVHLELKRLGYQVQSIIEERRGAPDEEVVEIAKEHDKVIVTMDKDFGLLAKAYKPPGVVLLRLKEPTVENRLKAMLKVLKSGVELYGYITVVTEDKIRRRPINR
ncbi:MAG: hypothetical protein GXO07_02235 [Crenarchaeota archaeon]|nr:hypothetical protein [Thermoproteota archaeon]